VVSRPRILDLFCGAGGAAMGYHRAGFDVVGVDIAYQPNYPFGFIQVDALDVRHDGDCFSEFGPFDAIHASPPCQAYSTITPADARDNHPDLVVPVRELLQATGLPYVIENVVGAPLQTGFVLCGSMFGLKVRRHRLFESNRLIMPPVCDHASQGEPVGVYGDGGGTSVTRPNGTSRGVKAKPSEFADLMGMPWATPKEIVQAIPPAYTEFIGTQLMANLKVKS
jgi:DNA (cytosine-5)-methyltransferase 1